MNFIYSDLKRYFKISYFKFLIIITLAIWLIIFAWPRSIGQSQLEIIYCQAGQGDATLIQQGFQQLLIDGGPGSGALGCLERHLPFFDKTIEMVIVTHPQSDHAAGLIPILERYELMSFVYNGTAGEGEFWHKLSAQIINKNIPTTIVAAGDKIKFGDAEFTVLWPRLAEAPGGGGPAVKGDSFGLSEGVSLKSSPAVLGVRSSRDPNLSALVLQLNYDQFSALFTSDIDSDIESVIAKQFTLRSEATKGGNLAVNVLKVAHHGSKYSSSAKFLSAIRPALSIIEVGKNSYGHPTLETIDRLNQIGSKILRTDQDGDITVITNGQKWSYKSSVIIPP